ncbi:hypothetical protein DBR40_25560 [Pedobacter sp. KBW01]|uniref:redoxin domain-containing protein n=1 Tax=Pedobacter sp. KBW01 TaxID=2153364 RepID=UPI000F5A3CCB|nr:redoxin domain-containing protein [Pedobacter sp. KBW01]RQO64395.1 hypothetical protein DBR40_25560 [Pedobacter sp. KBW01]
MDQKYNSLFMNLNSPSRLFTLIFSVLVTISLCYLALKKGVASPPIVEICKDKNAAITKGQIADNRTMFYDNYIKLVLHNENKLIGLNVKVQDTSFKKISLRDLISKKKTVIFRYSWNDCDLCIGAVTKVINQLKNTGTQILIITDSYSDNDFLTKAKHSTSKLPIYSLLDEKKGLNLPLEHMGIPFLFTVSPQGITSRIFIPFKEHPKQISEYLNFITQ